MYFFVVVILPVFPQYPPFSRIIVNDRDERIESGGKAYLSLYSIIIYTITSKDVIYVYIYIINGKIFSTI